MEDKERELLKSYRTLLDHVETCLNCRLKMEEILQHMIDEAKAKARREVLAMLEKGRQGDVKHAC